MRTLMRWSLLVGLSLIGGEIVYAQVQCSYASALGSVGTIDGNGVRHIGINMPTVGTGTGQVEQGTLDALVSAITAWNNQSGTTNIALDQVSSGGLYTVGRNDSAIAGASMLCAARLQTNVYIDDYVNFLGAAPSGTTGGRSNADIVRHIFMHEIGHALNLAHYSGGASVMEPPSGSPTTCADLIENNFPSSSVGTIQTGDAGAAQQCANRLDEVEAPDEGFGTSELNEECFDVYWVTVWFTMNTQGVWVVSAYQANFLYTTCEGNPFPE